MGKYWKPIRSFCTVPAFSLSKIEWDPGPPAEKLQAAHTLQYARINKHAMLFKERFWRKKALIWLPISCRIISTMPTKNQRSAKGVLISYSIGDKAAVVANQSKDGIRQRYSALCSLILAIPESCWNSK